MPKDLPARSRCPIATALDIIGDKWTLVVVRDMIAGRRRFSEFLESPEGIKRNILTDRLKRLEAFGILRRHRYQERPERFEYRLTKRGAALLPVIQAIAVWGHATVPETWEPGPDFLAAKPDDFVSDKDDTP
ncbi:winged helix-turn-helix transcriptional regulator [Bauldia sp.]|uniref:winged helix-turn-helix transcriptional regulator n=1 Tax=Bauldia sp. TaxID=2575872 RepID=UPI003BAB635E